MAVPKWARENMAKTGGMPTHGVVSKPSPFHSTPVQLVDGGTPSEAEFKRMGLEASNRELETARSQEAGALDKVKGGFGRLFDRLKAGNIDAPGSRAYEEMGAGRGRAEYEKAESFKRQEAEAAARPGRMENAADVMSGRMRQPSPAPAVETKAVEMPKVDQNKIDFEALERSSNQQAPAAEGPKPEGIFSKPNYGGTEAAEPKPESKPAPRRAAKMPAPKKMAPASGEKKVYIPDNPRPPVDNATRKEKPGARGGTNETRPSKETPKKSVPNDQRPSKPYPADAKPKGKSSDSSGESEVQKAGARYAATKRALDNAPKETSPTARKALEAAVEAARRDYEAKAKSTKR